MCLPSRDGQPSRPGEMLYRGGEKGGWVRANAGPLSCLEGLSTLKGCGHWKRHGAVEGCVVLPEYGKGGRELP